MNDGDGGLESNGRDLRATTSLGGDQRAAAQASPGQDLRLRLGELAILLTAVVGAVALGLGITDYLTDHPYVFGYLLAYAGFRLADLLLRPDAEISIHPRDPLRRAVDELPLLLLFAAAPFERTYLYGGEASGWIAALGLLMELVGLWLALGARIQLTLRLGEDEGQRDSILVRTGFYRYVRHPIYLGTCLVLFAWPFEYGAPIVAVITLAVLLAVMQRRIRREEEKMVARFGEEYESYRRETDSLVPNIW
ncbi:MAG: isoprenylcysteine carboxylmethyltransferase family protein [Candidatus Binataceae bacterium]